MVYEVDQGDILLQEKIKIDDEDSFSTLTEKTARLGGELLVKALDLIESKKEKYIKQDSQEATYTKMIQKEDGFLDFNFTATKLHNKVRALGENPGCYFFIGEDRIKVLKTAICTEFNIKSGEILVQNKRFLIGTSDGSLEILKCQAPNGKMLNAKDFLNGYKFKEMKVNDAT